MKTILDHTLLHQKYFEEMTQIPHGSENEKAYSDYLVSFAKEHGYTYVQDDMYNVIIYKEASNGYEDHEPLIMQAHMDMVCEKNKDSEHDFKKDPLKLHIEEGWLMADHTTLGADDGCGVAYMLAVLADDTLQHPALECIFTVQEEVGLCGALHLKKDQFRAKRMINLDDESGYATCTTSAGGMNVLLHRDVLRIYEENAGYILRVKGLKGGHSGAEIDKERGNANKLLVRVLYGMIEKYGVQLADLQGGLMDNAIPREASATFYSSADLNQLQDYVAEYQAILKKELEFSDVIELEIEETLLTSYLSIEESEEIIKLLVLLPNGLRHRSMSIEGLSTASSNVGVICMEEHQLHINCSLRGALESYIDEFAMEIDLLAELFGCQTSHEARYPAWSYDAESKMRETMKAVCQKMTGKELGIMATHGGLECGVFKAMDPDMDIVTLGPIMKNIHTPQEGLLLSSFDEIFEFLKAFLAAL